MTVAASRPTVTEPAPSPSSLTVAAKLHLYPPDHNAGAEWMVHTMLRALVPRGHRCVVHLSRYCATHRPYELDGVEVRPLPSPGVDIASVDVVVSHLENVATARALARSGGKAFVHVVHNTHYLTGRQLKPASARELAVFNSAWMREHYAAAAVDAPASIVVRPPVLAEDYATTPGDSVTLINLNEAKGGELFWRLAERMPDVPFLGVRGCYGAQCEGRARNAVVLPHTPGHRMRGRVYGRTRLLLMPSSYESWGRTGVEAMHSGIPVIAHPTPGLRESLGVAGAFVDRGDIDGWEAAIRRLLDPAAWAAASKLARARAAELDPAADLARWCDAVELLAAAPALRQPTLDDVLRADPDALARGWS